MNKEPAKSGAEQDVVTKWRRAFCYTQKAGVCAGIKRQIRRRARRKGKRATEDDA